MNYTAITNVLGKLLIVTGGSMVFPVICSLYYGQDDLYALAAFLMPCRVSRIR